MCYAAVAMHHNVSDAVKQEQVPAVLHQHLCLSMLRFSPFQTTLIRDATKAIIQQSIKGLGFMCSEHECIAWYSDGF